MNITLSEVVRIAVVVIPVALTLVVNMMRNSKNIKWRHRAEQLNKVQKEIMTYVPIAEQFVNFEGKDKKEWVLTKVNQFCLNNKIPYDDDKATEILEHALDLTRSVNQRGSVSRQR